MITEPHLSSFFRFINLSLAFSDNISIFSEIVSHLLINHIIDKAKKIITITKQAELNSYNIY